MGNMCICDDYENLPNQKKNRICCKCGAPYKTYHNSTYSHRRSCRIHEFSKKNKNVCVGCGQIINEYGPHSCYHY